MKKEFFFFLLITTVSIPQVHATSMKDTIPSADPLNDAAFYQKKQRHNALPASSFYQPAQ